MSWFNLRASNLGWVIVDIGSSSISANVVADNKILFSTSKNLIFSNNLNFQEFLTKVIRGLEETITAVQNQLAGKGIRSCHMFLSSPFYLATAQTSLHVGPKPFVVNERLIGNLLKTKIAEIANRHQAIYPEATADDWEILEKKIVGVRLNGYEIKNYLDRQTDKLEIDWFFTLGSKKIIERLRESIQKIIRTDDIVFHSFVWGAYAALAELAAGKNFLLLDVSGELTDVVVVTEGVLREHLSFPVGRSSIVRKFKDRSQLAENEIISQLRALAEGHLSPQAAEKLTERLKSMASDWLDGFRSALRAIRENTYIPRSIFLIGEDQTIELFADWLDEQNFYDITYNQQPFEAVVLKKEFLHEAFDWPDKVSHNAFLILETIYCDKIEKVN